MQRFGARHGGNGANRPYTDRVRGSRYCAKREVLARRRCERGSRAMRRSMTGPDQDGKIFVGKGADDAYLLLALANRHGLTTGATGTGKTVTLQVLAEGFSRAGVPVFAADIKGDLSGIAAVGEAKDFLVKRAKDMGFDYQPD